MHYFYILFLCYCFCACTPSSSLKEAQNQKIIAIVGKDTITQDKWTIRTQLLTLDSMPSAQHYALFQLVKMYSMAAIAQKYSYVLTDTLLQWETKRIDTATLMPDKLQRIKEVCQTREMYQEVFVKESLYPRWLQVCFEKDEKQHHNKAVIANEVFTQALLQANLLDKDSFKIAQGTYRIHTFWLDENAMESIQQAKKDTVAQSNFIDQTKKEDVRINAQVTAHIQQKDNLLTKQLYALTQKLQAGQLHPRVIDAPLAFWVLKHCGQQDKKYKIKLLEVPKNNFSKWLEKEIQQSPIQVIDSVAWKEMLEAIPVANTVFRVQN